MADPQNTPRRRADAHFTASEARDAMVKNEMEKERAAFDIRTAKLKALRMEKEKLEAVEKERLAAMKAASAKTAKAAKAAAKPKKKTGA